MAINIRKNNNIKGIQVHQNTTKISQLADDTTIIVQDIKSVEAVIGFLSTFSKYARRYLNKSKTEQFGLGKMYTTKTNHLDCSGTMAISMPRHLVSHKHCENDR